MALSVKEALLSTTVHILAAGSDGTADGTGFLYQVAVGDDVVHTIITNKHVVEGANKLTIVVIDADANGDSLGTSSRFNLNLKASGIAEHPDPDVDLCAVSFDVSSAIEMTGKRFYNQFLTSKFIPKPKDWEAMDAFEEVTMIGCPNGIYDTANHTPIARRGIAASHPAVDFEGRPEFMVDIACFAGSSGSPVFLIDNFGFRDKLSGQLDLARRRAMLLGILSSGPIIENDGTVLKKAKKVRVGTMMHLGYVIKSSQITEIEEEVRRRAVSVRPPKV